MKDEDKTKEQLVKELAELRQRVAKLEASETECKEAEVKHKRLLAALKHRSTQLQTSAEVSKSASTIPDPEELINQAVSLIQERFNFYYVGLFLVDRAGEYAVLQAGTGEAGRQMLEAGHRLIVGGESMIGWSVANAQPCIALDVHKEAIRFDNPYLPETRSEMALPLISHGQCLGALTVQSSEEAAFSEEDITVSQAMADQLAIAIESARLYQETAQRFKEMETLSAMITALTRSLNLSKVLQAIVDSATWLISASTSGVIHLADETAGKLIPWATSSEDNVREKLEMPIGKGIAGLAMQEKRPINVPNVKEDPRFLTTDTPIRSLLTAPLLIDRDCIGTLSLNSDQVAAFSANDERLLTTLAAQAAIAVRNARLHQEVQCRVNELTLLNRVGRAVTSSLDLEQILTTVMEETALLLNTEADSILLFDEESNELVFEAAAGLRSEEVKGLRIPLGQGIAGWVVREGQRLLIPNVEEDPRFYPGIDEAIGFATKSILAVPLKVKGKAIGVIEAVNKAEGCFSNTDVALLSSLAQWAAIAIENARLFEQARQEIAERKRVEEEIRRRNEELIALNTIATALGQSLDLNHTLNATLDKVLEMIKIDAGWIQLLDEDAGALSLVAHRGLSQEMTESHFSITNSPFSMNVPIKSKDKVMGVLGVFSRFRQLSPQEVQLLTAIGHQIGIAVENVRLAEEASEIEILQELNRLRSELIANVSHELRTPLGLIKIFCTSLLMDDVDFDRETRWTFLRHIDEETERLERIVDNLLDLSRMESERLRLDRRPTDVSQMAREIIETIKPEIDAPTPHSPLSILHDFPSEPLMATVDPKRIEQVLRNLLSNAIKYSPQGGTITVQGRGDKRQLLMRVSDQGIGIPPEDLERVFERFYRVENEITQTVRGAGLGLAVCRGIVEAHGGRIWVESTPGVGSTFYFTLPALSKESIGARQGPELVEGLESYTDDPSLNGGSVDHKLLPLDHSPVA
jgi:K+-sensing histidine kinase KdpD